MYKGAKYPERGVPDNALNSFCGNTVVYQILARNSISGLKKKIAKENRCQGSSKEQLAG